MFLAQVARGEDRLDLVVDVAPAAEPVQAVVRERRQRLAEDEDDHRRDDAQHNQDERAEHELGAPVCISP